MNMKKEKELLFCPILIFANHGQLTVCLEKSCAWYTKTYGDCAIKNISEVVEARMKG